MQSLLMLIFTALSAGGWYPPLLLLPSKDNKILRIKSRYCHLETTDINPGKYQLKTKKEHHVFLFLLCKQMFVKLYYDTYFVIPSILANSSKISST